MIYIPRESLRYWVSSHFVFKETLAIVWSSLASKVASKVRAVLCMHTAMLTRCYGLTSSPLSTACPFPSLLFPLPSFSFQSRYVHSKIINFTRQITCWWVHKIKSTLWRDGLDITSCTYHYEFIVLSDVFFFPLPFRFIITAQYTPRSIINISTVCK